MGYFDPENYMKVDELKHNYLYRIRARNGRVGVWDENKGEFILSRHKFGFNYTFPEIHADLSDRFGTAFPQEELELCPFDVTDFDETEMLEYLKGWEAKQTDLHPKEPLTPKNWELL